MPDAKLDSRLLWSLLYFRRLSDEDANFPTAVPLWTIADDLGVSADDIQESAARLAHAGLAEVTHAPILGPMARATDAAKALPAEELPHA